MTDPVVIHQGKEPVRRHFLKEWLDDKGMTPTELLEALNDPERSMDLPGIDKSQVYRWLKGQMPQKAMQVRIAAALEMKDPAELLRAPQDDWLTKFFEERSLEEKERARQMLEAAFPKKSA